MKIPLSVPQKSEDKYLQNMHILYQNHPLQRLFIFAADQRIEHLSHDFYGQKISSEAIHPEHIFKIASRAPISALATHFGPIDRYGNEYPNIPYIIKLNGKSNLIDPTKTDPTSRAFYTVDEVVTQTKNALIIGIGYTIYLGSLYEAEMLKEAAQTVLDAHQHGLVTILWIYPRGNFLDQTKQHFLAADATGLAFSLGADFVKIIPPLSKEELALAVKNGGNTKVICAGGEQESTEELLNKIKVQLAAGSAGVALGRNIFQHSETEALTLCEKIHQLLYPKTK